MITDTIVIGARVIVTAQPQVAGRRPVPGTLYRDLGEGRFRYYVWIDGSDRATGPYEELEINASEE